MILGKLGIVLTWRTPLPNTGNHWDSRVSIHSWINNTKLQQSFLIEPGYCLYRHLQTFFKVVNWLKFLMFMKSHRYSVWICPSHPCWHKHCGQQFDLYGPHFYPHQPWKGVISIFWQGKLYKNTGRIWILDLSGFQVLAMCWSVF